MASMGRFQKGTNLDEFQDLVVFNCQRRRVEVRDVSFAQHTILFVRRKFKSEGGIYRAVK